MASKMGRGWHGEPLRHSLARTKGRAKRLKKKHPELKRKYTKKRVKSKFEVIREERRKGIVL